VVDVYDDDWSRLAWVQLLGRVEVVEVAGAASAMDALAAKYEAYASKRPPGPLLRLSPERALPQERPRRGYDCCPAVFPRKGLDDSSSLIRGAIVDHDPSGRGERLIR